MAGSQGPTVKLTFAGDADQLDSTIKKVGSSTDGLGEKLKTGGKAVAGLGAAAGGAYLAAFATSLDFGASQAKLEAQLGTGTPLAADAGTAAGKVYASGFGESLDAVNEAMRSVISQGVVMEDATSDEMASITESALTVADTFNLDVNGAINAVAQMLKTGLAPDAKTAFDLITRGEQQGVDKAGDLLDTITEYSTQFRKLGLDGPTALGLLSQGLQAGARDADTVADALKEFSIRAIDGSKTTGDGFKALGLDGAAMAAQISKGGVDATKGLDTVLQKLRGIKDPVAQNAAAVALFGTKAEDLGAALFALDPSKAAKDLGIVAGATDKLGESVNNTAQNKIETMKREFESWTNSMVETQGPLGELSTVLVAFGGPLAQAATGIGLLYPVLASLGGVLFGTVVPAVWSFTAALLANPITWLVIGIAALIAGIVLLIMNFDKVKQVFTDVVGWIGDRIQWVRDRWNDFMLFLSRVWSAAWDGVKRVAGSVWDWFSSKVDWVAGLFGRIGDGIKSAFRSAFNFVADIWNNTIGRLSVTIPSWVPIIGGNTFSAPKIPKFHTGGVVPGAPGSEMLAILQAGETVTPAGESPSGGGAMVVTFAGDTNSAFATAFMNLVRGGQIQIGTT
jgi:phage-related minor tail protein